MRVKHKICFGFIVILMLATAGCSKGTKIDKDTVVSVNGENIYLKEMMYHIYTLEEEGNANEAMYQSFFGESFWDSTNEDGTTYRELAKKDVLDNAILYEVFYLKAKESGYKLSEEELEQAKFDATQFITVLTEKQKEVMKLTEEDVTALFEKISLARYYYEDFMGTLDVDEDGATSVITEEDYRQYDVEYLYIPIAEYDESGNMLPYSKEEKQAAYEKISALLPLAQEGGDFSDLIPEDDETMEVSQIGFLKGDDIFGHTFEEEALKLAKGQVSAGIIKEEDGYYIIKMMDDFSKEAYETQMQSKIEEAESIAFEKAYEALKAEYKIIVNEELWAPIVIGQMTYDEEAAANNSLWEDENHLEENPEDLPMDLIPEE